MGIGSFSLKKFLILSIIISLISICYILTYFILFCKGVLKMKSFDKIADSAEVKAETRIKYYLKRLGFIILISCWLAGAEALAVLLLRK